MIVWRADFIRCLDSDDESKIISEMKRSKNNIKPVYSINPITELLTVKRFNGTTLIPSNLTPQDKYWSDKVKDISKYMIEKDKLVNSSKTKNKKTRLEKLLLKKYYLKENLSDEEETEINSG